MCSCLQCPQLSELVRLLLWEHSVACYMFHRCRVCLGDWVDLVCSLYHWWGSFGSFCLTTLSLGFHCGLFPPLRAAHPLGFAPEAALEDWVAPVRASVEVVQLLGPQGFWQHQVLRGVGSQGSRKCSALEGDGNQCWPIRASILAWRTPLTERPGSHHLQGCRVRQD